jgi:hypothetical protein
VTAQIDASSLRVVRGSVTADELAAIVVVVKAVARQSQQRTSRPRAEWNAPHRAIRLPMSHGNGAWSRSALPR